ncbi:hypothetical protein KDA_41410 [Dictyobacter alpinus]|uniref:Carrier domain-containing protein n=1 Tax=Dictyobacter alpinus TaxID=2014873 RepID=A0A402BBK8_9CHLR|nr:acyl carrier protein [Dictyobacter alpinus]GCE28657.1 hypothetical protein KDA_41410 [Dictyobacter alpinus]
MSNNITREAIGTEIETMVQDHVSMDIPFSQETNLEEDLDMDSLERVELGVKLEKKFGVLLPDSVIRQCATIGDLTEAIVSSKEMVA